MIRRIALVAAVATLAAGVPLDAGPTAASDAHARAKPKPAPKPRPRPFTIPRGHSLIAIPKVRRLKVYAWPRGRRPVATLARETRHGGRRVLLVDWRKRRWTWPARVRVYLPLRPNGRRGWIRSRDVKFLINPYHVTVRIDRHRLIVRRRGKVVLRAPIGVGRALTPTPAGRYYLTDLLKQPRPRGAYGPWAFGTSAYSDVFQSFGGGPGQIGIHGTNQPQLVGTDVSHGCIRLRNRVIRRLARTLPLGTPVSIVVNRFNARAAFAFLRTQVRMGPRPAGSRTSRRLADVLRQSIPNGRFQEVPGGLRNVIGRVRGKNPKRVVLVGAHYDTFAMRGFLGANDGASATAVVRQLARTIKPRTLRPTIVFIFFDGEEAPPGKDFLEHGVRGSKVAARVYKKAEALILLDMVGDKELRIPREANSDARLWARLRRAAIRVGAGRVFPSETTDPILDDHIPFKQAGVRSIDVIDFDFPCWHKRCDRMSAVSQRSLDLVGESVLQLLREL